MRRHGVVGLLVALVVAAGLVSAPTATAATPTPNPRLLSSTVQAGSAQFSSDDEIVVVGDFGYFVGCPHVDDDEWKCGLYRTNGTSVTAVKLFAGNNFYPAHVNLLGSTTSHVYFTTETVEVSGGVIETAYGTWASDGTVSGTVKVVETWSSDFSAIGSEATFYAGYGQSRWKRSDGTVSGTTDLPTAVPDDANPGGPPIVSGGSSTPFAGGARAVYPRTNYSDNDALVVTDGTAAGTITVSGDDTSSWTPTHFTPGVWLGGDYYYGMDLPGDPVRAELWRTNGTEGGTVKVGSFDGYAPDTFLAHDGRVYFTAFSEPYGYQPWVTDGTVNGTKALVGPVKRDYSSATGYGSPKVIDGKVRVPMSVPSKYGGWDGESLIQLGTVTQGTNVVQAGPTYRIDPTLGGRIGKYQIINLGEYNTKLNEHEVKWYAYDTSKPLRGQPSTVKVLGGPKSVKRSKTAKFRVYVSSPILPYAPGAKVVVKYGRKVLASKTLPRDYDFTMSFPAKRLKKGKRTITFQYVGSWRVASSPIVKRTIRVK